jgi:hypothetical protein
LERRVLQLISRSLPVSILFLCVVALPGCGDGRPARVPISGQVTIDGQPLKFGSILFQPSSGRDGAMVGDYTVAVTGNEQLSEVSQRWHAPKKYRDPATSGLTAKVEGPRDDLNFELSWEGGKPFLEKL